jgi:hypothetical protein
MSINVPPTGEGAPPRASRVDLVDRLWQSAEAQVRAHECKLKALGPGEAGSEAHAKALATLARTIRELIELDAAAADAEREAAGEGECNDADPDAALASLSALREELARRLDAIEPGGEAGPAGGALDA